jgi:uncharacterized protein DUF5060
MNRCSRGLFWLALVTVTLASVAAESLAGVAVSGAMKKWHRVTLTVDGPETSETATPNPFLDYRLDVTFTHPASGKSYVVPGFYGADGNAAMTSAEKGDKWLVHFTPSAEGKWTYTVSFRTGAEIAAAVKPGGGKSAGAADGKTGSFDVGATDATAPDLRAKGQLQVVGEHYLQFAETGEWFLKCGADAPENLLAYADFDNTPNVKGRLKTWEPHLRDYGADADDLLWGKNADRGKGLLGAINYLASEGMNAFSFLTCNVDGDDRNVFPYVLKTDLAGYQARAEQKGQMTTKRWTEAVDPLRFDVSKLAQWDRVFEYGERKGMYLHFKMLETENDHLMDGGDLGLQRKLYCRELIARFGYHLALNWNLGEETKLSTEQIQAMAGYIAAVDPFDHNRVIHTYPGQHEKVYGPLLGDKSALTGTSIQTSSKEFVQVHDAVVHWVRRSAEAGKKWIVACDEPGDASFSLAPDKDDPTHNLPRMNALWGTLLGGGQGVEWYFGYKYDESDLTCQDWRSRDVMWDQCRFAMEFFRKNAVPFWKMSPRDELSQTGNWVLASAAGDADFHMVVQVRDGGLAEVALPKGKFGFGWFNPRSGEGLVACGQVEGGGVRGFNAPADQDWILLVGPTAKIAKLAGSTEAKMVFDFDPKKAKFVFEEKDGLLCVEAEHFAKQTHDDVRRWYLTIPGQTPNVGKDGDPNHAETAAGKAYLEILPDTRRNHGEKLIPGENFSNMPTPPMAVLYFPVKINTPGRYYVWVRCNVNNSEDNGLHVGLNGEWPKSGRRMQWTGLNGQWQWDSKMRTEKVHTGVPYLIYLDIEKPGLHTIMFSMREDGFEFDRFVLSQKKDIFELKSLVEGPAESERVRPGE